MKLIKPNCEIIPQENSLDGIKQHIERCARVCYKSENLIKEGSAEVFVNRMVQNGHTATLEHGTVYLIIPSEYNTSLLPYISTIDNNKYTVSNFNCDNGYLYITTNYRVIIENKLERLLAFISEPTEFHEKRVTVKFVCNRQVSHEFVRHRVFSFCQESTRYCNYTKGKFGSELTFIQPLWTYDKTDDEFDYDEACRELTDTLGIIEGTYFYLIEDCKWTPQQAATILPNALKTELVMTGFVKDWKHFFELRADVHAHPQAQELAYPLKEEFIKLGYIK